MPLNHVMNYEAQQAELTAENDRLRFRLSLYRRCLEVAGCTDREQLLFRIAAITASLACSCRFMGFYPDEKGLQYKVSDGIAERFIDICSEVLLMLIRRAGNDGRLIAGYRITPEEDPLLPDDLRDVVLVRLRYGEAHLGVVALFDVLPGTELSTIPADALELVCEQAASALQNADRLAEARSMLFIDDLSGLYNYRFLEVVLDRELKRVERYGSQLAVLFMDIDSFKQVNDHHGHLTGSSVLTEFGSVLKGSVRDVDFVIRYGGDEFMIILVETSPRSAQAVAERIRGRVEKHVFACGNGMDIRLTCSIGYACCPQDTMNRNELLELADRAMYAGKHEGKNRVTRFSGVQ